MEVNGFIPKGYEPLAKQFDSAYRLLGVMDFGKSNRKFLKPKRDRVCRYCGRKNGETTFRKDAHLIPSLLGNRHVLCDYECDDCNNFFGRTNESALATFMGISRTLTGRDEKEKRPTYTASGNKLKVRRTILDNVPSTVLSREEVDNDIFTMNEETGTLSVRFTGHPYVPIYVYKALLKCALAALSEETILSSYQKSMDLLMDRVELSVCFLTGYFLPFHFCFDPQLLLFQRKDAAASMPAHVMALYTKNFIFSLLLPLHTNDMKLYDGTSMLSMIPYPPVMFTGKDADNLVPQAFGGDFSSSTPVTNPPGSVDLQMNLEDLKDVPVYDPETGEHKRSAFNGKEIVKIVLRTNGEPLNPAQASKELNT